MRLFVEWKRSNGAGTLWQTMQYYVINTVNWCGALTSLTLIKWTDAPRAASNKLISICFICVSFLYSNSSQMWFVHKTMTTIEERTEYLNNPFFEKHLYGNWSPFYRTITICMVFVVILLLLNFFLGCVSKYKEYWQDRHTGKKLNCKRSFTVFC